MAEAGQAFRNLRDKLPEIQNALKELGLDGWLLFDLHARNAVAAGLIGVGDLSRRYFVLIPAEGEPIAVTHGIEQGPWAAWPWQKPSYVGWRALDGVLAPLLNGLRVAMEYSPRGAVPALDLVPGGAVELVRAAGAEVVSSGELITRFYSRWSEEGLASHRRASAVLADVASAGFAKLGAAVAAGESVTEGEMQRWVVNELAARGCPSEADCIFATGLNAANPHYEIGADGGATFKRGDVVMLDLWAKEPPGSFFAVQSWMGYLGPEVPARVAELFATIRDARDEGVRFIQESWRAGHAVAGGAVDDVVRGVVRERGYADAFIHRTGHSIDTATHGMGPNIDNLETNETRLLVPGIGFSIEPGVYLPGEIGLRTEIDVFMGADGPEVYPPEPQREVTPLIGG